MDWFSRENLQESPINFMGKSVVSCKISRENQSNQSKKMIYMDIPLGKL